MEGNYNNAVRLLPNFIRKVAHLFSEAIENAFLAEDARKAQYCTEARESLP